MTDFSVQLNDTLRRAHAPCLTSSFQAECVVLTHLLIRRMPGIPVLFLDTAHHFAETLAYRDELAHRWNLNLVTLRADEPRVGLWEADSTEACCRRHKIEPLFSALERYDVWFTALRREQSPSRASPQEVEPFRLSSETVIQRVSPLADWTTKDVRDYARRHDIPLLPLYDRGFTSIGCEPCTTLPLDALNPRSGRWRGQKLECGIHIQTQHKSRSPAREFRVAFWVWDLAFGICRCIFLSYVGGLGKPAAGRCASAHAGARCGPPRAVGRPVAIRRATADRHDGRP
jgi:phosphoadenosine phosphosulfate reductase